MIRYQALGMQEGTVDAALGALGGGARFDNAAEAAKEMSDRRIHAWEHWMAIWGVEKK